MKKVGIILLILLMLGVGIFIGYFMPRLIDEKSEDSKLLTEQTKEKIDDQMTKDEVITQENKVQYDLAWCNEQLEKLTYPLGWVCLLSDEASFAEDYHVAKGENLFDKENIREQLVMEAIVDNEAFRDQFITFDGEIPMPAEYPTDEMMQVYLPYDVFNEQYRAFFNEELTKTDEYVRYDNRRAGANGIRVEKIEAADLSYDAETDSYMAELILSYSERAQEMLGRNSDQAKLSFSVQNDKMILKQFIIE